VTPILPRPKSPFLRPKSKTVKAGALLHRAHENGYGAAEFNPGKGQPTRFAPFICINLL